MTKLNPRLQAEIDGVKNLITAQAEKYPLPPRFEATPHQTRPFVDIVDITTKKHMEVPLYAYGEVRNALSIFFS